MASRNGTNGSYNAKYSPVAEARRIFDALISNIELRLPAGISHRKGVRFTTDLDDVYFPIPLKETETTAALKAVEGSVAAEIAALRYGDDRLRHVTINLEKVACFLLSSYLATVGGYGKLDPRAKNIIKGLMPLHNLGPTQT